MEHCKMTHFCRLLLLVCASTIGLIAPAKAANYQVFEAVQASYPFIDIDATGLTPSYEVCLLGLLCSNNPMNENTISDNIGLGFNFQLDDTLYNQVRVSDNGILYFGTANSSSPNNPGNNTDLPTDGVSGRAAINAVTLMPAWDNFHPDAIGGVSFIKYRTVGVAPNRIFIMQFKNVPYSCNALTLPCLLSAQTGSDRRATFQVQLHENGVFAYAYGSLVAVGDNRYLYNGNGVGATIGYTKTTTDFLRWKLNQNPPAGAYSVAFNRKPNQMGLSLGGSATFSVCSKRTVTLFLRDRFGNSFAYLGKVRLSFGDPDVVLAQAGGAGVLSTVSPGVYEYQFHPSDNGSVALELSYSEAKTVSVSIEDSPKILPTLSGNLRFAEQSFVIEEDQGGQTAGLGELITQREHDVKIQAWKKDKETGLCGIASEYTGAKNIRVWKAPTAQDSLAPVQLLDSVGGLIGVLPPQRPELNNVTIPFTDGEAFVSVKALGSGQWSLSIEDEERNATVGNAIGTSSVWTVRPFTLWVGNAQNGQRANPGGTASTGNVFGEAGSPFVVEVKALSWNSLFDLNSDGVPDNMDAVGLDSLPVDAYYRHETAMTVTESSPADANHSLGGNPLVEANLFNSGVATSNGVWVLDFGAIKLNAQVANYKGAGWGVPSVNSQWVGRFVPAEVSVDSVARAPSCVTGNYTYFGEPGNSLSVRFAAKNVQGQIMPSYDTGKSPLLVQPQWVLFNGDDGVDLISRTNAGLTGSWIGGIWQGNQAGIVIDGETPLGGVPSKPQKELQWGVKINNIDEANLSIEMADRTDQMGACVDSGCVVKSIGDPFEAYSGRVRIENKMTGSLNSVLVPVRMEVWSSSGGWVLNKKDSCTVLDVPAWSVYNSTTGISPTPEQVLATKDGIMTIKLNANGIVAGNFIMSVNLGGGASQACEPSQNASGLGKPYLQSNWCGAGKDPSALIQFGSFNSNPTIQIDRALPKD